MSMRIDAAIIDCLVSNEITTIFGIPGKQTLPLNKVIDTRDDIRYVMARHETNVSHQAWGYAESSGEMAATVVIPGPGDLNATNGLKNARNDCTPLLHIAVETEPSIRGGDAIHETPPNTYDTVVKENITVETPQSTIAELERAISIARTPPKGPVRIGIPKNFVAMDVELPVQPSIEREYTDDISRNKVRTAADKLAAADAPTIIAGGGIRTANASAELQSVAEQVGAPVAMTYKGKGTIPADHPLTAGILCGATSPELRRTLENADVLLAVGTDFDAMWTNNWAYDFPADLIHVTLEASDIGRGYDPTVAFAADAKRTLSKIGAELQERSIPDTTGSNRATEIREAESARMEALRTVSEPPITTVSALEAIRQGLPRDTIVTADAGGSRIWTLMAFPVYNPRDYVNTGSWASMGLAVPAGIGAKVANPTQPVAVIIGEGGLMMCLEELHTMVAESIDVTVFVFNNNDYAVISEEAERTYDLGAGTYSWSETPVDCTAIAAGMGMETLRAKTPDEIVNAATESIDNGATLVEIPTDPNEPQASAFMNR